MGSTVRLTPSKVGTLPQNVLRCSAVRLLQHSPSHSVKGGNIAAEYAPLQCSPSAAAQSVSLCQGWEHCCRICSAAAQSACCSTVRLTPSRVGQNMPHCSRVCLSGKCGTECATTAAPSVSRRQGWNAAAEYASMQHSPSHSCKGGTPLQNMLRSLVSHDRPSSTATKERWGRPYLADWTVDITCEFQEEEEEGEEEKEE